MTHNTCVDMKNIWVSSYKIKRACLTTETWSVFFHKTSKQNNLKADLVFNFQQSSGQTIMLTSKGVLPNSCFQINFVDNIDITRFPILK